MRAVFVTNQRKTEFYSAVARKMEARGATVYWISVGERWTKLLTDKGWPRCRILSLADYGESWSQVFELSDAERARARRIDQTAEAGLKNILIMDRELSKRPGLSTEGYVHVVLGLIENFIVDNDIDVGFGEPTWAPELLTAEVMRAHGRAYYMPHTIRIPSSRFAFFSGIFHDDVAHIRAPNDSDRALAQAAMCNVRSRGERPFYFARNMNPQRWRNHWVEEAMEAVRGPAAQQFDHTVPDVITRSRRRIQARYHARLAQRSAPFETAPEISDRPYVLVLLHKQPESSVDVWGNALSNQLEVIRALSRLLPFEWEIWVKEHGHAIGDRTLAYYKELASLPGCRLIAPEEDSMALIKQAGLVASVSGTACMEAGVLGVPAVTFGSVFFAPLLLRSGLNPFALSRDDMATLLSQAATYRDQPSRDRSVLKFLTGLVAQSFDGIISDPVSAPECMEPDNVSKVADAVITLMRRDERATAMPIAAEAS